MDPRCIKVHGLTDDYLADRPFFGYEHAQKVRELLRGAHVYSWGAEFDHKHLDF